MAKFEKNRMFPIKPCKTTKKFAVYDIESANWNQFLIAGFYDGEKYNDFTSMTNFCQYIFRKKYRGWTIYAHFGGGYDHRFILQWLVENRPELIIKIIENAGNILGLYVWTSDKKSKWSFFDSYQLLKGSLKDLTKAFNVEHKKIDFDAANITEVTPEVKHYLRHDVLGLYEVLSDFYSLPLTEGVGHKMTVASLSMSVFKLKYLQDTILYKVSEEKEEFIKNGYYGGRVEIFKAIATNVFEYDVNSMYPDAMRNLLPCGGKGRWCRDFSFDRNELAFIDCTVETGYMHIPVLPFRHGGKLLFPIGKWRGVYFSKEVELALQFGYKIKIHRALVFPGDYYLKQFAEDMYKIREENPGKNAKSITAKYIGNGGYGKFAQARERTFITNEISFEEGCKNGYALVFPEYNLWRVPTYSDSPNITPYVSAAITSYSRIKLYNFLIRAGENLVYTDTDSIFAEGVEYETGKGLGELKLENHFKKFAAIQPKFYCCEGDEGNKLKAKGFVTKELSWCYNDFEKALYTGDYTAFFQQQERKFSKLNEAIKAKDLLMLVSRKKSMRTEYSKRIIVKDGWSTKPIEINEGEV
jgi:hypothetical protein